MANVRIFGTSTNCKIPEKFTGTAVIHHEKTGDVYTIIYQNGLMHSTDDQPCAMKNIGNPDNYYNEWRWHGILHRETGPAIISNESRIYALMGSIFRCQDQFENILSLKNYSDNLYNIYVG